MAASYSASVAGSAVVKALGASGAEGAKAAGAVTMSIGGASEVGKALGALEQAGKIPAGTTQAIVHASNSAFVHAMSHAVIVGAVIAAAGALVALGVLPSRPVTTRSDVEDLGDLGDLVVQGAQNLSTPVPRERDLLGATLQLLGEAGFSSLNFNGIASKAGISTGAIERGIQLQARPRDRRDGRRARRASGSRYRLVPRRLLRLSPSGRGRAVDARRPDRHRRSARRLGARRGLHVDLPRAPHRTSPPTRSTTMVDRAVERRELAPDVDAAVLVDTLVGPLYHRLLITGEPITADVADDVVELVLEGAARRP